MSLHLDTSPLEKQIISLNRTSNYMHTGNCKTALTDVASNLIKTQIFSFHYQ